MPVPCVDLYLPPNLLQSEGHNIARFCRHSLSFSQEGGTFLILIFYFLELCIHGIFPFFTINCAPHVSFPRVCHLPFLEEALLNLVLASVAIWNKNELIAALATGI